MILSLIIDDIAPKSSLNTFYLFRHKSIPVARTTNMTQVISSHFSATWLLNALYRCATTVCRWVRLVNSFAIITKWWQRKLSDISAAVGWRGLESIFVRVSFGFFILYFTLRFEQRSWISSQSKYKRATTSLEQINNGKIVLHLKFRSWAWLTCLTATTRKKKVGREQMLVRMMVSRSTRQLLKIWHAVVWNHGTSV
jgi:hypothetical protein